MSIELKEMFVELWNTDCEKWKQHLTEHIIIWIIWWILALIIYIKDLTEVNLAFYLYILLIVMFVIPHFEMERTWERNRFKN